MWQCGAVQCGRAFFDLTEKALQDYFHAKKSELNVNTLNEEVGAAALEINLFGHALHYVCAEVLG